MHDHTSHIFWRKAPTDPGFRGGTQPEFWFLHQVWCSQVGPKIAPRAPKIVPRCSKVAHKIAPRAPKIAPRCSQVGPKIAPKGPKVGHKMLPSWSHLNMHDHTNHIFLEKGPHRPLNYAMKSCAYRLWVRNKRWVDGWLSGFAPGRDNLWGNREKKRFKYKWTKVTNHILICTTIPITFFWRKAPTDP